MKTVKKLCIKCGKPITLYQEFADKPENCYHKRAYVDSNCNGALVDLEIPYDDYITLCFACSNTNDLEFQNIQWNLYDAMVELYKKDIIEYNLKMAQFRMIRAQKGEQAENARPKCPHCKSTNFSRLGIFESSFPTSELEAIFKGNTIGKSFRCNKCGYTW